MLGLSSGFFSAKGMSAVPLFSDMTASMAETAIIAAGLTFGSVTTTTVGATSQNNGKVQSSSIVAGTLVDYETEVSIVVYSYVTTTTTTPAPPPMLLAPTLGLGQSGNASGGRYFQVVYLTNLSQFDASYGSGTVDFSPFWFSYESDYPEYIVEGSEGSSSLTVTASRAGYASSSSTIYFTLGPAATTTTTPAPCNWNFLSNFEFAEFCRGNDLWVESGYSEIRNCNGVVETRNIVTRVDNILYGYCAPPTPTTRAPGPVCDCCGLFGCGYCYIYDSFGNVLGCDD